MPTEVIEHFMDGLNLVLHPTKIKNTEVQLLENMEVRPTSVSDTLTYLALTVRNSYKRLHTDVLTFIPKNLIQFVQRVTGGSGLGSRWLVTGGYVAAGATFRVRALLDGATTQTAVSDIATASDSGLCSLMIFNKLLFYTNGVNAWRKWDGVTDAASGFATVTKFAIKHKSRAIYGNDVTNTQPHYVWISDVFLPETVAASNFFAVGDASDPLIGLIDQVQRILIVKERSTWALYLAPILANSTLLRVDEYKGSLAPLGVLWANQQTYVATPDVGIQGMSDGLHYDLAVPQLYNFLKGFQNSLAALGVREDQLLISTLSSSVETRNNRVFAYDLEGKKLYQHNLSFSAFCSNRGTDMFGKRYKAIEEDGTNRYIVELDMIAGQVESTITGKLRTKEFTFGDILRRKGVSGFTIEASFPNTTTALTLKVYSGGTLVDTQTFIPTVTGIQRKMFHILPHVANGYYHSFQLEYAQPGTVADKFAVHSAEIQYDPEMRIE